MKVIPITDRVPASEPQDVLYHIRDAEGREWVLLYADNNHSTSLLKGDTLLYQQPGFTHKNKLNCLWFYVNHERANYAIIHTDSNAGAVALLQKQPVD
jgi:hypothetical protein